MTGIVFSIVLVMIQMGLYLGFGRMVTTMIDHASADLWIMPKGTKCFEDPSPKPAPANARNSDSKPASQDAKAKLPRVSDDTQKSRDDERRRILEQEIADETKQLAQAKEQLASQEAVRSGNERNYERFLERVQPYRDAVATHERNLEAIRREIANLK